MRALRCLQRRIVKARRKFRRFGKRILSIIIMGGMISILSIFACADMPDGAMPTESVNHFIWYLNSQTGYDATVLSQYTQVKSNSLTVDGLLNTNYVWAYPFADMKLTDGTRVYFEKGNTYHLTLTYANGQRTGWATMSNFPARLLMSSSQALSDSVPVTQYSNDNTYSCTVVDSQGLTTVDIVFHITSDLPGTYYYIAPFIRFTGGTQLIISNYKLNGYIDPDLSIFESLMAERLDAILGVIQGNGEQNHEDLTNIWNELKDNGEGNDYDTSVENAVSDLGSAEDNINSSLQGHTFELGGSTILVDENVFSRLDNYFNNLTTAEGYDVNTGVLINRTFDVFVDYMGIVIVISLTLGTAVSFLSHREVWRN